MNTILLIYGIAIMLMGIVCIYNMVNYIRYYNEFKVFNENVKNWAKELDASAREAIGIQARIILQELDEKINAQNEQDNNNDENLQKDGN